MSRILMILAFVTLLLAATGAWASQSMSGSDTGQMMDQSMDQKTMMSDKPDMVDYRDFRMVDKNDDDMINVQEFTFYWVTNDRDAFYNADTNGDGELSEAEWKAYATGAETAMQKMPKDKQPTGEMTSYTRDYAAMDTNGDGKVSWREFEGEGDMDRANFTKYDANNDGVLSPEEYKDFVNKEGWRAMYRETGTIPY